MPYNTTYYMGGDIVKKYEQYTKEELQKFCDESESLRDLAEKIGYNKNGGSSIKLMKEIVEKFQLNISHFNGGGRSKKLGKYRTPTEDYIKGKIKVTTHKLRLRLIAEGYFEEKCNVCGNTEWLGEKIPLELHHKDGDKDNNSLENLEIICPNCHVFTDTYKTKNRK